MNSINSSLPSPSSPSSQIQLPLPRQLSLQLHPSSTFTSIKSSDISTNTTTTTTTTTIRNRENILSSQIRYEHIESIDVPTSGGSGGILRVNLKPHSQRQFSTTTTNTNTNTNYTISSQPQQEVDRTISVNTNTNTTRHHACIYLKAGLRIAAEAYAGQMAQHIGIHSPDIEIIERNTQVWEQLQSAIRSFLDGHEDESEAAASLIVFDILSSGRVIACVSGVIGVEFLSIDKNMFKKTILEKQWIEIGALIAFDMITNNSDRFPSPVWENNGNGGNVIFETLASETRVVGIDHTPVMLKEEERDDYIQNLKNALIDLLKVAPENTLCANRVSEFIQSVVKYEMDITERAYVSKGMIAALQRMIQPSGFTIEWLEETRKRLENVVVNDPVGVWKESMNAIDVSFLDATLSTVREIWNSPSNRNSVLEVEVIKSSN
jgi:hypothetical protein